MKHLGLFFGIILFALTVMPAEGNAQLRNFYQETFTPDTLTNSETVVFTPSKYQDELCSYSWVMYFDRLSGTASFTILLQESAGTSGSLWINKDTITVSSTTTDAYYEFSGAELLNPRQRISVATTGTQSSRWSVQTAFKRRDD